MFLQLAEDPRDNFVVLLVLLSMLATVLLATVLLATVWLSTMVLSAVLLSAVLLSAVLLSAVMLARIPARSAVVLLVAGTMRLAALEVDVYPSGVLLGAVLQAQLATQLLDLGLELLDVAS
jgi:hypothetical protein